MTRADLSSVRALPARRRAAYGPIHLLAAATGGLLLGHALSLWPPQRCTSQGHPSFMAHARDGHFAPQRESAAHERAALSMLDQDWHDLGMHQEPINSEAPAHAAGGPAECSVHVGVDITELAVGILTSNRFIATRLHAQQVTWLTQVRDVVFYAESDVSRPQPLVAVTPPPKEELVGGGAWKNFPALLDLHQRFPKHKWIFFCDDDTYVFVPSLLHSLSKYPEGSDLYVGMYLTPRLDLEWKEVKIAYASGGAGYALSRTLLRRLAQKIPECTAKYTRWAGDLRVGKCVRDVGVRVTPGVGFHHERHDAYKWDGPCRVFPYGPQTDHSSTAISAPITFHHLPVDYLSLYFRMQVARAARTSDGELHGYDFAPLMFNEFRAYSPTLRQHFKLIFGISLEASPAKHARQAPRWHMNFSDPLYIRPLSRGEHARRLRASQQESPGATSFQGPDGDPGANSAPGFSMVIGKMPAIFDGDGCDAASHVLEPSRQPHRRAADIHVICEPCVPQVFVPPSTPPLRLFGSSHTLAAAPLLEQLAPANASDGLARTGVVCDIYESDDCTLRLTVSVNCPERRLLKAVSFDVGTSPGAANLVHMGGKPCGGLASSDADVGDNDIDVSSRTAGYATSLGGGQLDSPLAVYPSLSHGAIETAGIRYMVDLPDCELRLEGDTALVHGGVLRKTKLAMDPLVISCVCVRAAGMTSDVLEATVRLLIRLVDFSSPSVTLRVGCSIRPRDGAAG